MRRSLIVAAAILAGAGLAGPSIGSQLQRTAAQEAAPPAVLILGSRQAESVLGKEVRSKSGESMGRLIDVVVDRTGQPRAAVIDFGGFFGVGNRKIAIDWNALSFESDSTRSNVITVDLTRDQVKAAPEYKDKRAVIVLGSSGSLPPAE